MNEINSWPDLIMKAFQENISDEEKKELLRLKNTSPLFEEQYDHFLGPGARQRFIKEVFEQRDFDEKKWADDLWEKVKTINKRKANKTYPPKE